MAGGALELVGSVCTYLEGRDGANVRDIRIIGPCKKCAVFDNPAGGPRRAVGRMGELHRS
jgi:hypothetical protein